MQQQQYTSTTTTLIQIPGQTQRQMSRSEYMQAKNLPIPNPARKFTQEKEASIHTVKSSSNPANEFRRQNQESQKSNGAQFENHLKMTQKQDKQRTNNDQIEERYQGSLGRLLLSNLEVERLVQRVQEQMIQIQNLVNQLNQKETTLAVNCENFKQISKQNQLEMDTLKDTYQKTLTRLLLVDLECERLLVKDQQKSMQIVDLENQNISKESNYRHTFENLMQEYQVKLKDMNSEMFHRESKLLNELKSLTFKIHTYEEQISHQCEETSRKQTEIDNIRHITDLDSKRHLNDLETTRSQLCYSESQLKKKLDHETFENQRLSVELKSTKDQFLESLSRLLLADLEVERLLLSISEFMQQQTSQEEEIILIQNTYSYKMEQQGKLNHQIKVDLENQMVDLSNEFNLESTTQQNRIDQYEDQITMIAQENERLSNLLHLHQHESDDWKERYQLIQMNFQNQIHEITHELQICKEKWYQSLQRVLVTDLEVERLLMKIQEQEEQTQNETSSQQKYEAIILEYQSKLDYMSMDYSQEVTQLQNQISLYEDKLSMISTELEHLTQVVLQQDIENQRLNIKIQQTTITNEDQIQYNKYLHVEAIEAIQQKQTQETNLSQRLNQQQQEKIVMISLEMERITSSLHQKEEQLQDRSQEMERTYLKNHDIQKRSEQRIEQLNKELDRLSELNDCKDSEMQLQSTKTQQFIQSYEDQLRQAKSFHQTELLGLQDEHNLETKVLQKKKYILEERLLSISQELEHTKQELIVRDQHNMKIEETISSYEDQIQYNNSINAQNLIECQNKYNQEINYLQRKKLQSEEQIVLLTSELERLNLGELEHHKTIASFEDQIQHSNSTHTQEIDELYSQYTSEMNMMQNGQIDQRDLETRFEAERVAWEQQRNQQQQSLQDWENRYKREKESSQTHIDYLEKQLDNQRINGVQKNKELCDKIKELDQIKEKYQSNAYSQITQTQRVSLSRQSIIKTTYTEQDENTNEIHRMKSSSSVPPQPNSRNPRQAMSILNINEPTM